ncbi:MAG: ABC transporter substrate-binding protein [Desulfofustis sp.]|jgi:peptide/nickel transport system substrate-binding protein|nr:ABC transporter substrate-binding protein [Desulfofustis sp.]
MSETLTIAQSKTLMEEPHNCTDAKDVLNVLNAFFDPLVAYDAQMNYVPALATSWQVSDDARTWTFSLRPGVQFHDGQPLDAEAVVYSLQRMARSDMGVTLGAPGVYHQYLDGMRLEITGPHRLQITLAEPLADLLDVLVTGYILPPGLVERLGADFRYEPVGTGPYRFVDYEAGVCIRAQKNPDYFGASPRFETIEWNMIPDPGQRLRMIENGQAQLAAGPPFTASLDPSINYVCSRGTTAYIIIFNLKSPLLQDPRVRVAINLGVDRPALIDAVLNGAGYPLNGFISPAHYGYDHQSKGFPYDPDRARMLLREAGFPGGLSLTLDSPTSLPDEAVRLSGALSEQLSRIGVAIDVIHTEDREHYANKVRRKDIHDLCVFDSSPLSTFRVLKEKVDSRFEGSWWQGYSNTEVEELLDTAQSSVDDRRREALYRRCFGLLNEDPPWLYLYNYKHIICTSPGLSGWKPPLHNIIDPRYL